MHIVDRVYGEHYIDEPAIRELISSAPMQRLKGLTQYGLPHRFYPVWGFSRFEHSVGVMLLLRSLQGSLTQQAAGLLHDVSHTAFSHVTDTLFGKEDGRNAQDERHFGFIMSSGLPSILSRHRLSAEKVADLEAHPLLDRETPDLCADRVDYSLREFSSYMGPEKIKRILDDLIVHDHKIVFSTHESAALFSVNYMICHVEKWASPEKTVRQHFLASVLRTAMNRGVLDFAALMSGDDEQVLKTLAASKDPCIQAGLRMLSGEIPLVEEEASPQLSLQRRSRFVDPEVVHLGRLYRLSAIDSTYREMISAHKALHSRPLNVTVLHRLGSH